MDKATGWSGKQYGWTQRSRKVPAQTAWFMLPFAVEGCAFWGIQSLLPNRENILKTAKALVEDTKMLVAGAASSQDKLAQAAQSSAKTITQLTEVVKLGSASIGSDDPETQVSVLSPRKQVLLGSGV